MTIRISGLCNSGVVLNARESKCARPYLSCVGRTNPPLVCLHAQVLAVFSYLRFSLAYVLRFLLYKFLRINYI